MWDWDKDEEKCPKHLRTVLSIEPPIYLLWSLLWLNLFHYHSYLTVDKSYMYHSSLKAMYKSYFIGENCVCKISKILNRMILFEQIFISYKLRLRHINPIVFKLLSWCNLIILIDLLIGLSFTPYRQYFIHVTAATIS